MNVLQWPVLVGFVLLAFALIYYYAPDVKQSFRFVCPGSLVGVVLWLVFSLLFSLYVNAFGSYNRTYGALAGVAILMLYLYYAAFILLYGAEMNQVIEEHAPGGKGEGEKVPGEKSSPDAGAGGGKRGGVGDRPDTVPRTHRSSSGSTKLGVVAYLLLAVEPLLWRILRERGRSQAV